MVFNDDIKKKLENIPWKEMEPDNITDIPSTIIDFVYANEDVIDGKYWNLVNSTVHNLELNQCAFYIIPFLLSLINTCNVITRHYVFKLIYEILLGSATSEQTIRLGMPLEQYEIFNKSMMWDIPLKIACRNAIAMGIPIYLKSIETESSESKLIIAYILSEYPEYEEIIVPVLSRILIKESSEEVRQVIQDVIDDLEKE